MNPGAGFRRLTATIVTAVFLALAGCGAGSRLHRCSPRRRRGQRSVPSTPVASSLARHCHWAVSKLEVHPLGIITVSGAAAAALGAAFGRATRRWVNAAVSRPPRRRQIAITVAIVLVILPEVRQQTRAALLIAGT